MDERFAPAGEAADEALVARLVQHDSAAFRLLYERYVQSVYTFAAHVLGHADAEEAVQDVFLRLWHHAARFDATRSPFSAWFMAIARHRILDELRRRTRQAQLHTLATLEQTLAEAPPATATPEEQTWQQGRDAAVLRALQSIPDEQRRVLILAYFGGLSHANLAQQLGCPLGTVKKRLRLGLQKLRIALSQEGFGTPSSAPARKDRGR